MVCAITKDGVIRADFSTLVARRLSPSFRQPTLPISVHPEQNSERDSTIPLSLRRALVELFLPGVETPLDARRWTVLVLHGSSQ